jgi:hypothetical protein
MALSKIDAANFLTGTIPSGNIATSSLAAAATGKILQVKLTSANTEQSINNVLNSDITGLSVTITPASTSSKFLITASVQGKLTDNSGYGIQLIKTVGGSATEIFNESSGAQNKTSFYINSSDTGIDFRNRKSIQYLDSPSTTSEIVYKVQVDVDNNVTFQKDNNQSYMSVMEVSS